MSYTIITLSATFSSIHLSGTYNRFWKQRPSILAVCLAKIFYIKDSGNAPTCYTSGACGTCHACCSCHAGGSSGPRSTSDACGTRVTSGTCGACSKQGVKHEVVIVQCVTHSVLSCQPGVSDQWSGVVLGFLQAGTVAMHSWPWFEKLSYTWQLH